jgi:Carboxylesterase family
MSVQLYQSRQTDSGSHPHTASLLTVIKEEMSMLHESAMDRSFKLINGTYVLLCQVGCGRITSDEVIIDCLRRASPKDLTAQQFSVGTDGPAINSAFHPTVDNQFISRPPAELLLTGQFQKKSIVIGANRNEGTYFLIYLLPELFGPPKWSSTITPSEYRQAIESLSLLNTSKDFVLNAVGFEYSRPCDESAGTTPDYVAALDRLLGDALITCPVVNFARTVASDVRKTASNLNTCNPHLMFADLPCKFVRMNLDTPFPDNKFHNLMSFSNSLQH